MNYLKKAHSKLPYRTPKQVNDKINEFDIVIDNTEYDITSLRATTEPTKLYTHKGYALDCSGWICGTLHKDNPRFEAMIYDGNKHIAVKPETIEKV